MSNATFDLLKTFPNEYFIYEGDPTHPYSWVCTFDANGKMISQTYARDPAHSTSWVCTFDANGKMTSRTYGQDPKDACSWVCTFDANGETTSMTYGQDPKNPRSWSIIQRFKNLLTRDGKDDILVGSG